MDLPAHTPFLERVEVFQPETKRWANQKYGAGQRGVRRMVGGFNYFNERGSRNFVLIPKERNFKLV